MLEQVLHYKIKSQIGEGGMGSVFLGEDEMLDRKVAIKVLNPQLTSDTQFRDRFKQEAKLQASLLHTNIVTLYSFISEGSTFYMVMEYAEGATLKELIQKTGLLPEERALKILRQLLDGVGYAHSKGVIHRDIKPSNIIVDSHDNVKIMDFGIAKLLGDKGMTKTGTKMGTLYYMSPEQIQAIKDIDGRTDIYSLGITLYEMLTGQIPFNADTESEYAVMKEIIEGAMPDPRLVYPHISDSTISMLNRMAAKDRNARPATSKECFRENGEGAIRKIVVASSTAIPRGGMSEGVDYKNIAEKSATPNKPQQKIQEIPSTAIPRGGMSEGVDKKDIAEKSATPNKPQQKIQEISWVPIEGGQCTYYEEKGIIFKKQVPQIVNAKSFFMSATAITFDQYDLYCEETGAMKPNDQGWGRGTRPVIAVNVADAVAFCNWLSQKMGTTVRLPEENEWEYAARGGSKSKGYVYSGSNSIDDVAWYEGNSRGMTHDVATKKPNELGLYDMSGNVWEWCGTQGVVRGGSWYNVFNYCRVSNRYDGEPGIRYGSNGFRVLQNR